MRWTRRLSQCFKFIVGASVRGAVVIMCIGPFIAQIGKFDFHHMSIGQLLLSILVVIPGILLLLVSSVVGMVMRLVAAFRSITGTLDVEAYDT